MDKKPSCSLAVLGGLVKKLRCKAEDAGYLTC